MIRGCFVCFVNVGLELANFFDINSQCVSPSSDLKFRLDQSLSNWSFHFIADKAVKLNSVFHR